MSSRLGQVWSMLPAGSRGLDVLRHLPHFARLYWRLLRDRRVSIWPKALLVSGVLYVLSPVDFIPDVLPLLGQVDDLVLLAAVCGLFIYLCPPGVVREHVRRIDIEAHAGARDATSV